MADVVIEKLEEMSKSSAFAAELLAEARERRLTRAGLETRVHVLEREVTSWRVRGWACRGMSDLERVRFVEERGKRAKQIDAELAVCREILGIL